MLFLHSNQINAMAVEKSKIANFIRVHTHFYKDGMELQIL